jgi:hypothetical protein
MNRTATLEGARTMNPTIKMPCRVDLRPVGSKEFCEWTGRIDQVSATGCSIRSAHTPDPGARLELRIYLPGNSWPMQVQEVQVVWNHWGEFTVEFLQVAMRDRDQLEGSLTEASMLMAA